MTSSFSSRCGELARWGLLIVGPLTVFAMALSACGGGGGEDAPPVNPAPERLTKASQPGEVLAHVKRVITAAAAQGVNGAVALTAGAPAANPAPTAGGDARSNTTAQEAGVDEEDLIKTDGTHLYTLNPLRTLRADPQKGSLGVIDVHTRQGATGVSRVGTLELPYDGQANGSAALHHAAAAQRLAVVGQGLVQIDVPPIGGGGDGPSIMPVPIWHAPRVELRMVGVATPAQPTLAQSLSIDGWLVGSRRIGSVLVLAMTHTPRLPAEVWSTDAAVREAALAQLTIDQVLPQIRIDGGLPQALLAETDCYTQLGNASPMAQVSTITAIDLNSLQRSSRCFVGGAEALYMSASNLYLATSRFLWSDSPTLVARPVTTQTDIHQFSLAGTSVNYRASGTVEGHLGWNSEQRPYRFSEHNGLLRVLSFTGQFGWFTIADAASKEPSPATLTVLRENNGSLQTVATLPNAQRPAPIGKPGEQVFGVRFAGDRAYVVTFRQVDPLYVLDLSVPADPKAVGVLEVPGFSDYLYPLRNGLLLGVGKDADVQGLVQGVKLGLFDVSNPAAPREVASRLYGGRGSRTALDFARQGLNLFERSDSETRAALPVAITNDGSQSWQNGLLRLTIDTAAKTWRDAPLLASPSTPDAAWHDVSRDRATQIGDSVYYFSRGVLQGAAW
jgi:Beta propeller domain